MIFVGGAPRSGTTLVQNILDSHTSIVGPPEFLHVAEIVRLGDKMKASVERGWIEAFCSKERVNRQFQTLVSGFLIPFLEDSNADLLSEKTPANVLVLGQLLELLPGARLIHVVRDPRATVSSLLCVGQRAREQGEKPLPYTAGPRAAAWYVRRCLAEGLRAERLAPKRVHRVHYERLVTSPREEYAQTGALRRLRRWLSRGG
ncbi:MAG: sulfotransferase [Gemmatimonadetes bacterium]|nr:sulfotransferase [Gemmatimonadota bacterium]